MTACDRCLARTLLLELLSNRIDLVTADRRGARSDELLALGDRELCEALLSGPAVGAALESVTDRRAIANLRERVDGAELWAVCRHDDGYPVSLEDLAGPPAALFGRGEVRLLTESSTDAAVTLVGARKAGEYGRSVARVLARETALTGITVVSGLALGVDAVAHEGALEGGGRTLAVLGGGADRPTPRRHDRLAARILEAGGAVVSELAPGQHPRRWSFPARNRIMAAIAGITVVVAAAQRSGSLITARVARDLGRTVGAVPGPVTAAVSAGSNALLADGAAVVRDARDVLDHLLGPGSWELSQNTRGPSGDGAGLLLRIEGAGCPLTADALVDLTGMTPTRLASALTELELGGWIERHDGRFVATRPRTRIDG